AAPQRLVVGVPAMAVGADVDVVEKHFAALDASEAVAEVHAALADRFDLGPQQDDAGLERLEEMEIVERLPILGDGGLRFLAFGLVHHAARASLAASRTAAIMLSGSATPLPAMSNAVP